MESIGAVDPARSESTPSLIRAVGPLALLALTAHPTPSVQVRPQAGAVMGAVRFAGTTTPTPTRITNTTDPDVCGLEQTLEDFAMESDGNGLRYTIVAIEGIPDGSFDATEPEPVVIDNRSCRFDPHAAVAMVGATIEAVNSDPVLHTTHLYGPREANISLPVQGARVSRRLDRAGTYVIKCDVHGWMQAFVRVDPHPFHAVTEADGTFEIRGIPPGEYALSAWHETLGTIERNVRIEAGTTARVELTYAEPQ